MMPGPASVAITSGSWGCGAFSSSGDWFQLSWPDSWAGLHITIKELLPVVLGAALWGSQWRGHSVKCWCDNAAVVAILKSGRSKDCRVMHLMRSLFFFTASFDIQLIGGYIPGSINTAADALSRDNQSSFFSQVPSAKREPTVIPECLLQALVHGQPDWTSLSWTQLLKDFLQRV